MKKKTNAFVLTAAILILLCVAHGLITWQQRKSDESNRHREEEQIYMASIEGISSLLQEKDGQDSSFEKEGDTWYYQIDRDYLTRQYTLPTLADTLSKLRAERCLDVPDSLASYESSTLFVRLRTRSKDGTARIILVGSQVAGIRDTASGYTDMVAKYYAYVEGNDQVYAVGNYLTDAAGERFYDFAGTEFLPHVTGADTREITVTKEGKTSHFLKKTIDGEDNTVWHKDPADREEDHLFGNAVLNNLAQAVGGLFTQSCITYRAVDEELGSSGLFALVMAPSWTYEEGENSGTVTLAIGSPDDEGTGYYARRDDFKAINLISKETAGEYLNAVFPE